MYHLGYHIFKYNKEKTLTVTRILNHLNLSASPQNVKS